MELADSSVPHTSDIVLSPIETVGLLNGVIKRGFIETIKHVAAASYYKTDAAILGEVIVQDNEVLLERCLQKIRGAGGQTMARNAVANVFGYAEGRCKAKYSADWFSTAIEARAWKCVRWAIENKWAEPCQSVMSAVYSESLDSRAVSFNISGEDSFFNFRSRCWSEAFPEDNEFEWKSMQRNDPKSWSVVNTDDEWFNNPVNLEMGSVKDSWLWRAWLACLMPDNGFHEHTCDLLDVVGRHALEPWPLSTYVEMLTTGMTSEDEILDFQEIFIDRTGSEYFEYFKDWRSAEVVAYCEALKLQKVCGLVDLNRKKNISGAL